MIDMIEMIDDLNEVEQDDQTGWTQSGRNAGPKWDGPNRNGTTVRYCVQCTQYLTVVPFRFGPSHLGPPLYPFGIFEVSTAVISIVT
jgi:hypothetical protein